ncbi:MAG TPA: FecR domain-containing protein, partial [Candidatus Solibacter sp.]|nr:FecR domain-containing protein [Candidatus Solibacter sp.]
MNTEMNQMDPALEQAVTEIRDESVDPAVIEAAAGRVWAKLSAAASQSRNGGHNIGSCADFQSLIPGYRAGRLSDARALLLKDHLHECVACRKVFEGKVVAMPAPAAPRRTTYTVRWALAAAVFAAAGVSVWVAYNQFGAPTGRAIVKTVNGTLYEILPTGIQPLAQGQDLPDGIEIRTAKDSGAVLQLRDGSEVELRERSGFSSTQTSADLTIHLDRGSIIVQAAHRSQGHLFVATADCRVAVTGTVFSVSSGDKGSRVSVIQGEVHVSQDGVSQDNRDKVLHPGDQTVTSASLEPVSVKDDIAWSRNRARLVQQLEGLRAGLAELHLPQLRYSSRLAGRLPASTAFFASIPNLGDYLGQAQVVFRKKMDENPELRAWWSSHGMNVEPVLQKLQAASEYLGDEIVIAGFGGDGQTRGPVFLAETKREGLADFLKREGLPLQIETRNGLVAFSPSREALTAFAPALDSAPGGFQNTPGFETTPGFQTTPFWARIAESYRDGAGLLLAADLSRLGAGHQPLAGAR